MHDIKYIRENAADFDAAMRLRGFQEKQSDAILALDKERRGVQTQLQRSQNMRNEKSQEIGEIKKAGGDASEAVECVALMKNDMARREEYERTLAESLNQHLAGLPNILADDVPEGKDEAENVEVHYWPPHPNPLPVGERGLKGSVPEHFEIGEALGLMDFEAAAKMSGARFVVLSGGLARLERALAQFFLDTHTGEAIDTPEQSSGGYTEVSPPLLVRYNALYGTGQLPKFEEDLFKAQKYDSEEAKRYAKEKLEGMPISILSEASQDELFTTFIKFFEQGMQSQYSYLIPTSEVSLTNIVAGEIVAEDTLPRRYTAFTPCFRSEAGSAGKDTRGMIRQHQFYKVEMVGITKPEDSEAEQERMVQCAQTVLEKLELAYRTVKLCSGDTGFGARRTFDIEVWLPGQQRYREISSVSTCGDFQARRMNARYKNADGKNVFVHTLNGSGVAVGRALIAVMENYYDPKDGGVFVPEVLKPYMGGLEKIEKLR